MILGEAHVVTYRGLSGLLFDGIVWRVSHGTAHLPSSRRYYPDFKGHQGASSILGFNTPSDYVRAYPVSREWLTLLIRRMDAVASIYRLPASTARELSKTDPKYQERSPNENAQNGEADFRHLCQNQHGDASPVFLNVNRLQAFLRQ